MCGILGSVNQLLSGEHLDLIKHRGPDASGERSFNVDGNQVMLMHRRLSIVDLSEAGNQPMASLNATGWIVFNGEIYNHLELKERLAGIPFRGHSDTETIVNYFHEFGIERSLKDLNGIFAFAYLDLEKQLLYLARDRYGIKPLYFYFGDNKLIFSSEIRPIRALLEPGIDQNSLMGSLQMRYSPAPATIYKGIYKVEPGQLLTFDLCSKPALSKSYFIATPSSLGTHKGDYQKLVQEYGSLFEKAIDRQLMADVEVGVLLSGGVDSALVASIAKQRSKTRIKAFTVGFEGHFPGIDEIGYAQETASVLGLEHFSRRINAGDFFSSIRQIVEIVEEPIGTTSIIPMFFLSDLAASKVKVVLSGQGADEPLGGYYKYKGLPLLEVSRLFKHLLPLTKGMNGFYDKSENLRRLVSSMQCADNFDSFIQFNSIASDKEVLRLMAPYQEEVNRQIIREKQQSFKQQWVLRTPAQAGIKDLFLYYDLRTSLADDLLMYTDKITMHYGLECRVPILDNDLIDFIESLDSRYKFNMKRGKIIHKDFARESLPSAIIERKKMGFKSPTETWFMDNKDTMAELFSANKAFGKAFDLDAVRKLIKNHGSGKNLEKQLFWLLSINFLLDPTLAD